jgi:cytidylate kinase
MVDAEHIRQVAEHVVTQAAKTGNSVIVGRGSAYYLRDRSDTFHVFVYAPFEEKVQRLCAQGKSDAEASELAETVDRDRAAYIKQHFDVEWPARHFFHLMLNTTLGDEFVVQTILDSVSLLEKTGATRRD